MTPGLILKLLTLSIKCLTCSDTVTEKREQKRERTLFLVSNLFILDQKFEILKTLQSLLQLHSMPELSYLCWEPLGISSHSDAFTFFLKKEQLCRARDLMKHSLCWSYLCSWSYQQSENDCSLQAVLSCGHYEHKFYESDSEAFLQCLRAPETNFCQVKAKQTQTCQDLFLGVKEK